MRYFEDLEVGEKKSFGSVKVDKDEIIDFAKKFDPQYFHIDEEAAKKSIFGSLCASGWYTASITHRMVVENYFKDLSVLGSPGGDTLRWRKPVFPGDTLSVELEVMEKKNHNKYKEIGIARMRWNTFNQNKEIVMSLVANLLVNKRNN
ncbi:MAG: MaoC family dehydratase [Deferribacterota bacterium]|nr:MaoC family dehydratase [Deferribacterota bacterium]